MRGFDVKCISGDEQSQADVLFIHGLGGDARTTWTGNMPLHSKRHVSANGDFWPGHLTPDRARVWLASYPAPLFEASHGGKTEQAFEEEGEEALRRLEGRLGTKPLIIVAHSLGGLLAKAILVASNRKKLGGQSQSRRSIADATAAVFFLATPHSGSDRVRLRHAMPLLIKLAVAVLVALLGYELHPLLQGWASNPVFTLGSTTITVDDLVFKGLPLVLTSYFVYLLTTSRHLALLDPGSTELRTLRDHFREFLQRRSADSPVRVRAFYEMVPTRYYGLNLGILVSWSSADPGLSDVAPEPVDASHIEICKPPAVYSLRLLELLEETIDDALAGTKRLALEDSLRKAQVETAADSADWHLLNFVIGTREFEAIPAAADGRQPRRETEEQLRAWVRQQFPNGVFRPERWQLARARTSPWSMDRVIWQVAAEYELETALKTLREEAERQFSTWPPNQSEWPGLITFYRPLRTIEAARIGEWRNEPVQGLRIEAEALDKLVIGAYEQLEGAHDHGDRRPDGDGATRWLLLRMACIGRAISVVLSFVGYPDRQQGIEPENMREKRKAMYQRFATALRVFENELNKPLQQP